MGDNTRITYADATWNPVSGCDQISTGCDNCYAKTIANRFTGTPAYPNGFQVTMWPARLETPYRWRRPRRVFTCSTSDLFHNKVPNQFIAQVLAVAANNPWHTFLLLTKRPARMRHLFNNPAFRRQVYAASVTQWDQWGRRRGDLPYCGNGIDMGGYGMGWPLPNVWCGVTCETQPWADVRVPQLLATPAAARFISAEPLLGPLTLCTCQPGTPAAGCPLHDTWPEISRHVGHGAPQTYRDSPTCSGGLDWLICGGESGPGARPMNMGWAASLHNQCQMADVAFYGKQLGTVLARQMGAKSAGTDATVWPFPQPRQYPVTTGRLAAGQEE